MINIHEMTRDLNLPVKHIKMSGRPDVPYVSWQDTRVAMDARAAEQGVTVSYEILDMDIVATGQQQWAKVHSRITMIGSEGETTFREAVATELIGRGQAPPFEVAESSAFKRAAMRWGFSSGINGEWASESRPQPQATAGPRWGTMKGGHHVYGADASLRVGVRKEEDGSFSVAGFRGRERFDLIDPESNAFLTLEAAKTFAERRYNEEKDGGKIVCSDCSQNPVYAVGGVCGDCQMQEA